MRGFWPVAALDLSKSSIHPEQHWTKHAAPGTKTKAHLDAKPKQASLSLLFLWALGCVHRIIKMCPSYH